MSQPLLDELMVQQQVYGHWAHMCAVIMLNQTGRKPVKTVLPEFLERWPTPERLLRSRICDVEQVIKPLGMWRRRAKTLYNMSIDYLAWDHVDARDLHGIGKYGADSYDIFFKHDHTVQPTDKELLRYLREVGHKSLGAGTPVPSLGAASHSEPVAA
jgi:methyl-CpG-binding domain protein 4